MVGQKRTQSSAKARSIVEQQLPLTVSTRRKRQVSQRMKEWMEDRHAKRRQVSKDSPVVAVTSAATSAAVDRVAQIHQEAKERVDTAELVGSKADGTAREARPLARAMKVVVGGIRPVDDEALPETQEAGTEAFESVLKDNEVGSQAEATGPETNKGGLETDKVGSEAYEAGSKAKEVGSEPDEVSLESDKENPENDKVGPETNGAGPEANQMEVELEAVTNEVELLASEPGTVANEVEPGTNELGTVTNDIRMVAMEPVLLGEQLELPAAHAPPQVLKGQGLIQITTGAISGKETGESGQLSTSIVSSSKPEITHDDRFVLSDPGGTVASSQCSQKEDMVVEKCVTEYVEQGELETEKDPLYDHVTSIPVTSSNALTEQPSTEVPLLTGQSAARPETCVVDDFGSVMVYSINEQENSIDHSHTLEEASNQSERVNHITDQTEGLIKISNQTEPIERLPNQDPQLGTLDSQSDLLDHIANQSSSLQSLSESHSIVQLSDQSGAIGQLSDQRDSMIQLPNQSRDVVPFSDQSHSIEDIPDQVNDSAQSQLLGQIMDSHTEKTSGKMKGTSSKSAEGADGEVQILLSSNDSVTQALLESFMADNSSELEEIKSPEPLPTEHHIAPNVKLTETVQVDENGKKHTVVYLSTADMESGSLASPNTQLSQLNNKNIAAPIRQPSHAGSKLAEAVLGTKPSGVKGEASKSQDVVIEVYVSGQQQGEGKKIQNVRVINRQDTGVELSGSNTDNLLTSSLQTTSGLELYSCNKCDFTTDKKFYLQKHVKVHHNDRPHMCLLPDCGYSARTFSNLKRHQLSHTDERKYPCPHCDLRFKQKIHLDKHINYIHREKNVKCDFCEYVCANRIPDLKLHMKRRHLKNDVDDPPTYLECDKCGFLAASRRDLKQHFKFHKRGPELKLFCEHCSFVTDAKSRLDRHRMIHTKEKPYSCSLCDYRASQKEHIRRHHRTRHRGEPDLDSETLVVKEQSSPPAGSAEPELLISQEDAQLTPQLENPSMEECVVESTSDAPDSPYPPDPCSNTPHPDSGSSETHHPESGSSETPHLESGSSETPHIDSECSDTPNPASTEALPGMTTAAFSSVTVSEKKVNKYKPPDYSERPKSFACTHCTMRFVRLLSLYKHLHTQHSDLLPSTIDEKLTCVVCEFKAQSHKALLVHMRKHSAQEAGEEADPGSLYVCVLCKYMNNKRRNLYQHLKKKHKISMLVRKDGTVSCVVEPNADVTVISSSPGQQVTEVVKVSNEAEIAQAKSDKVVNILGPDTNRVVNLLDLANSLTHKHDISQLLQKELRSGNSEQAAAEAIVDLATQSVVIEEEVESPLPATAILESDENGQGQLQVSEQQLHSLSTGDFIEIDGQTYKVETRGDSVTAVLCEQEADATCSYLSSTDDMPSTDDIPSTAYSQSDEVVVAMPNIT